MLTYRLMSPDEIARIGEVNREETITHEYIPKFDQTGFGLIADCKPVTPPRDVPSWSEAGTKARAEKWKFELDQGGFLYGAFNKDRLAGFILLGPRKMDRSAEIVALFVDKHHRRLGIGHTLIKWVEDKARSLDAQSLYLYSNPTLSAINFYLKQGFKIVGLISKEIVVSLPGDIIMAKLIS